MSDRGDDLRPGDSKTRAAESYFGPRFLARLHARLHRNRVTGLVTKTVVTLIGVAVMLAGVIMMVTPGPGLVALALGLAILSTEWRWADRWLDAARTAASRAAARAREIDPDVRRRRLLATFFAFIAVVLATSAALNVWGWPGFVLGGWEWVQDLAPALPDLPRLGA